MTTFDDALDWTANAARNIGTAAWNHRTPIATLAAAGVATWIGWGVYQDMGDDLVLEDVTLPQVTNLGEPVCDAEITADSITFDPSNNAFGRDAYTIHFPRSAEAYHAEQVTLIDGNENGTLGDDPRLGRKDHRVVEGGDGVTRKYRTNEVVADGRVYDQRDFSLDRRILDGASDLVSAHDALYERLRKSVGDAEAMIAVGDTLDTDVVLEDASLEDCVSLEEAKRQQEQISNYLVR